MRLLLAVLTYVVSLAVVAVVAFFSTIFLAGPHGGALPEKLQVVILPLAWLAILVLPALAARAVWVRSR